MASAVTPRNGAAGGTGPGGGHGGRRRPAGGTAGAPGAGARAGETEAVSPAGAAARPGTAARPGIAAEPGTAAAPGAAPRRRLRLPAAKWRLPARARGAGRAHGVAGVPQRCPAVLGALLALLGPGRAGPGKGWPQGCEWNEEAEEAG